MRSKIVFFLLLLVTVGSGIASADPLQTDSKGAIKAKPIYDESYFIISRTSIPDALKDKVTLSANKFGEEYQPQEGQNEVGETSSFYWDIQSTSPCTANTEGIRTIQRSVICKKYDGETRVSTVVEGSFCNKKAMPAEELYCIDKNSEYQWLVQSKGKCSTTCGEGSVQRLVSCLRIDNKTGNREIVIDNECNIFGLVKPSLIGSCVATSGCTSGWNYGAYTACQGLCGEQGTMTRTATCRDNEGNVIDNQECLSLFGEPLLTAACTPDCSDWVFTEWSECQSACFEPGVQTREAMCKNSKGKIVPDESCPGTREILEVNKTCTKQCPAATCAELKHDYPSLENGSYPLVGPKGTFTATCDMTNGGWTLIPNLAFLDNFDNVNAIDGLNEEQLHRFKTLYEGGMSSWINYYHLWSSGQRDGKNPSWYHDIPVGGLIAFSKSNNLQVLIESGVNAYSYASDKDAGRLILYLYDSLGTNIYSYDSGYNNWASNWSAWYRFYYDGNSVPDPKISDLERIRYYFSCYRYTGTKCSANINAHTYINYDLPKTNFYMK